MHSLFLLTRISAHLKQVLVGNDCSVVCDLHHLSMACGPAADLLRTTKLNKHIMSRQKSFLMTTKHMQLVTYNPCRLTCL